MHDSKLRIFKQQKLSSLWRELALMAQRVAIMHGANLET